MKSFFLLSIACLLTTTLSQSIGDGQKKVNDIIPLNSNSCPFPKYCNEDNVTSLFSHNSTNSNVSCVKNYSYFLGLLSEEDQRDILSTVINNSTNNSSNGRCFECQALKQKFKAIYRNINKNTAWKFEKFSESMKNSFSCIPKLMKGKDNSTQGKLKQSFRNIVNNLGGHNSNSSKLVENLHNFCLSRKRHLCSPLNVLSSIVSQNLTNGTIRKFKFTSEELNSIAQTYIAFAASYVNLSVTYQNEYKSIVNNLANSSSCLNPPTNNSNSNNTNGPKRNGTDNISNYTKYNNSYPNYTYPNNTYPNYTYPNNTYPNYTYPNNTYPNYTYPNYTYPNYTYPNYTYPNYTYPNYTYPNYTYPNNTYPNYTYPNNTYPNYTYPNYTYPNNTYPNYTYPNSTYPNSTFNNGTNTNSNKTKTLRFLQNTNPTNNNTNSTNNNTNSNSTNNNTNSNSTNNNTNSNSTNNNTNSNSTNNNTNSNSTNNNTNSNSTNNNTNSNSTNNNTNSNSTQNNTNSNSTNNNTNSNSTQNNTNSNSTKNNSINIDKYDCEVGNSIAPSVAQKCNKGKMSDKCNQDLINLCTQSGLYDMANLFCPSILPAECDRVVSESVFGANWTIYCGLWVNDMLLGDNCMLSVKKVLSLCDVVNVTNTEFFRKYPNAKRPFSSRRLSDISDVIPASQDPTYNDSVASYSITDLKSTNDVIVVDGSSSNTTVAYNDSDFNKIDTGSNSTITNNTSNTSGSNFIAIGIISAILSLLI